MEHGLDRRAVLPVRRMSCTVFAFPTTAYRFHCDELVTAMKKLYNADVFSFVVVDVGNDQIGVQCDARVHIGQALESKMIATAKGFLLGRGYTDLLPVT